MPDPNGRPLSPHLSVYRPEITSVLSILHRLSGLLLGFGMVALAAFLVAAAAGPEAFALATSAADSLIGCAFFVAVSIAFFYHLANGVRHLFWDAGFGFELVNVQRSGWFVVALTAVLTGLFWLGVGAA
ncbi:MAG: succinate dehydrogenase, cytochrome b556 subunit [Rhodospirillales bacterium]|nr:succinate dehydrogenase, cytochrome b556 subunit [Rhodospirillales bacterium]MYE19908.1 succinate dehydrogenase, cytochrome b556 subunit [Rhodospirillales bacterium]